jgi:hypothetical protein
MRIFTKILFFILFLSACSTSKQGGMTSKEVYRINHRAELQKLQRDRQARAKDAQKAARKIAKNQSKEAKAIEKQKKKEEKAAKKALKKQQQRHLDWQSAETRERIKKNKKESTKQFSN